MLKKCITDYFNLKDKIFSLIQEDSSIKTLINIFDLLEYFPLLFSLYDRDVAILHTLVKGTANPITGKKTHKKGILSIIGPETALKFN